MSELIIKFCHPNRDVRPPSPSPPPPLLIMIFMIFIIFLMQTIIKIRHLNRDFEIPIVVAKIPIWLVAQVQVEEIVFMAVRNFKASLLPPPAPTGGCCSPLCIIVSYCQMMAMGLGRRRPGNLRSRRRRRRRVKGKVKTTFLCPALQPPTSHLQRGQ